jgi:hypothetical protein
MLLVTRYTGALPHLDAAGVVDLTEVVDLTGVAEVIH